LRTSWVVTIAAGTMLGGLGLQQQQRHLNPVVDLLAKKQPVFGLYAPANPRVGGGRGRGGATVTGMANGAAATTATPPATVTPVAPAPPQKTPADLAKDAVAYKMADYIFDGSMESPRGFDRAFENFDAFAQGMGQAGFRATSPARITHPLFLKTPIIAADTALAAQRIAKQLNAGASGIVFVGVESADEVKRGLAMMRFKSKGGIRPDDVGGAPALWGMSEKDYKDKADVWPLNPKGELVNFTIVESIPGLAHVREIAAVKGIGVLFPGAGTLGQVFSTMDSTTGRRVRDDVAWEASIQQVLAACKEFNVPCGFPANTPDVLEMRMKQGFSVFVIGWGENGFKTVETGLKLSGRDKP
jgi:4-hydroxy-2-oxoheptanedioate aldolase